MTRQWHVYIDWDDNGSFADSGNDITPYVIEARISEGFSDPLKHVAKVGTCSLTLDNTDKRFSPMNGAGPYIGQLIPGKSVKVTVTTGSEKTIFIGYTRSFTPQSGTQTDRQCIVDCVDNIGVLQGKTIDLPLIIGKNSVYLAAYLVNKGLDAPAFTSAFQFNLTPIANDWAAITTDIASWAYTFGTAYPMSSADGVYIDGYSNTVKNLVSAINQTEGLNTTYGPNTLPSTVKATMNQNLFLAQQAKNPLRLYRLNEPSGANVKDYGTNGRDATASGGYTRGDPSAVATWDPDAASTHFDNISAQVSIPTFDMRGSFTIEMLADPELTMTAGAGYAFSAPLNGTNYIHVLFGNNTNVQFGTGTDAGYYMVANGIGNATFHLFAFVYDADTGKGSIYRDGSLVAGPTSLNPFTTADFLDIRLGISAASGAINFKGWLESVAIYMRALSAAEILDNYNALDDYLTVTITEQRGGATGVSLSASSSNAGRIFCGDYATGADRPSTGAYYETGRVTIPYAGQDWKKGKTNALSAITEVMDSEYGLLYQSRSGVVTYHNRDFIQKLPATAAKATFSNTSAIDMRASLDDVYNVVDVTSRPKSTIASGVIASAQGVVKVPTGGAAVTLKLDFIDPSTKQACGATSVTLPLVPTTDWTANDKEDGSGTDYTGDSRIKFWYSYNGSGITIGITNLCPADIYLTKLWVRGTGVVNYNPVTIEVINQTSITNYKASNTLSVNLPLADDLTYAASLANYLCNRYSMPVTRAMTIDAGSVEKFPGTNVYVHDIELFDVLIVTDAQSGLTSAKMAVIGVQYGLKAGEHTAKLVVSPLDDTTYWILGDTTYGVLGSTTRLGI